MKSLFDLTASERAYAGVGSRETPRPVLDLVVSAAALLARRGWTLRTGGAQGADTAFVRGHKMVTTKRLEVFLPWPSFNEYEYRTLKQGKIFDRPTRQAFLLAEQHHPAWANCDSGARALHARNCHQVLGRSLDDPVAFVLCWTPNGSGGGGTGQAIRIAEANDVPVFDLGREKNLNLLKERLRQEDGNA